MYSLAARCLTSLMYASLPYWGGAYMPVRVSARSLLFLIIGRILYSSVVSSGMDHSGMYMYPYSLGSLNSVISKKL